MMYSVIKMFTDLQDSNYKYEIGDTYPREGLSPTAERIAELSGSQNKQGTPLIEAVEDVTETAEEITEEIPETEERHKKRSRHRAEADEE